MNREAHNENSFFDMDVRFCHWWVTDLLINVYIIHFLSQFSKNPSCLASNEMHVLRRQCCFRWVLAKVIHFPSFCIFPISCNRLLLDQFPTTSRVLLVSVTDFHSISLANRPLIFREFQSVIDHWHQNHRLWTVEYLQILWDTTLLSKTEQIDSHALAIFSLLKLVPYAVSNLRLFSSCSLILFYEVILIITNNISETSMPLQKGGIYLKFNYTLKKKDKLLHIPHIHHQRQSIRSQSR